MSARRIVVINLPERRDRRRETEAELKRAGFPPVDFFPAIRPADRGVFGSIGEHGAYLSHRAVLESAPPGSDLLVLEDDVRFSSSYAVIGGLISGLPSGWSFFYGGHEQLPERRTRWSETGLIEIEGDVEFIGAHCYAINASAIPKVVSGLDTFLSRPRGHVDGGPMPIDGAFNIARRQLGLRSFAVIPPVAHQRSSKSDIAPLKWFDSAFLARDVAPMVRRMRNSASQPTPPKPSTQERNLV